MMDSNQHRYFNQAYAAEVHKQKLSLNRGCGESVGSSLVHLGGQLVTERVDAAVVQICHVWSRYTIVATPLILDSGISSYTVCFYYDNQRTVYKISHFGNYVTLGTKTMIMPF